MEAVGGSFNVCVEGAAGTIRKMKVMISLSGEACVALNSSMNALEVEAGVSSEEEEGGGVSRRKRSYYAPGTHPVSNMYKEGQTCK